MEEVKNIMSIENQYLKENISMEKEKEWVKNILKMVF